MASLLNSKKDISFNNTTDSSFTGQWEDIKDYTSAIITLQSPMDGSATLQWAHTSGRSFPTSDTDIIASETFRYDGVDVSTAVTKQFDHRARWFRIKYENETEGIGTKFNDLSFNLQTLYKKAATELKIVDDCANIVSVNVGDNNKNSLYTMLTDASGAALRTTNDSATGEALYTHLADSSGYSLATTETQAANGESLFVALRDGSNNAFSSTGADVTHNALYIRPGDSCGNAQASTYDVSGASTAGVALYAALADSCGNKISTTNQLSGDNANALYVHLATKNGKSVTKDNPLPVVNTQDSTGALAFDVSYGITESFIAPQSYFKNPDDPINIYNLFVYNDSPVTIWVKIYDVCESMLSHVGLDQPLGADVTESQLSTSLNDVSNGGAFDTSANLKYNLTVPGGRSRDLTLPGGTTFDHGLYVRATTQYKADSVQGPGENAVFFNGSYTK
jgi:hypothetical protein